MSRAEFIFFSDEPKMKYHSLQKGCFYFQLPSNQMSAFIEEILNLFLDSITRIFKCSTTIIVIKMVLPKY